MTKLHFPASCYDEPNCVRPLTVVLTIVDKHVDAKRGASAVPVEIMREEPVTLLNESVPVEQLFVSLLLVPHHGGRHVVAPAGAKHACQNKLLAIACSRKTSFGQSSEAMVSRKAMTLQVTKCVHALQSPPS